MNRWTVLFASIAILALFALGCSGGGVSPVTPDTGPGLTTGIENHGAQGNQVIWGYYDLFFDFENGTVEAVPNRDVTFTANVVMFVNNPTSNLAFVIHDTPVDPAFIDVDIDVAISHPFPGVHQYDGWDVRGIFMGVGSGVMNYDGDLAYAIGGDQEMYDYNLTADDPYDWKTGMPDGYTRWWNATEFVNSGPLGYTQGALATPGYQPSLNATLNPYKYFCDGLGPDDELWTWLTTDTNAEGHGIFSAGATNTRNYYLRFPMPDPAVQYGYAIAATWGEAPGEPPPAYVENAVEAIACTVDVTDAIYWVDDTNWGGNLIADINLWAWEVEVTAGVVETILPSVVYVESDLLGGAVDIGGIPVGGGPTWSTYACDVPTTNVTSAELANFWVIAEYSAYDYTCAYPAAAPDAPLAAFFKFDLYVSPIEYCDGPVITDVSPDQLNQDSSPTVYVTGTDLEDGSMLMAWLTRDGEPDIEATGATWNDATSVDFTFDVPDTAALGMWNFNMTHDECGTITTLYDEIEIVEPSYDIVQWDGSPLGDGPLAITVKGSDYSGDDGTGTPVPPHGDYAIDLAVRPNDGGVYLAWAEHRDWDYNKDYGYKDRYVADMSSVPASMPIFQYGYSDPLPFAYRDYKFDCNDGPSGSSHGWGAQFGNAHIATNENMTPDNGPTLSTWDYWGIAYGNPPYTYGRCVGAAGGSNGTVHTLCGKYNGSGGNVVRVQGYVPDPSGNWDFWLAYLAGQLGYSYVSNDDYDGGSSGETCGIGMGSNWDTVFFGLREDAPHVIQYANRNGYASTGTPFGADGTDDGQISNPIDITIRDNGDRIYVLDEPATGMTRIQCFSTSGTYLAGSLNTDASVDGGGAPYRMDYNEFHDCIYVLYDNNTIEAWIDNSI